MQDARFGLTWLLAEPLVWLAWATLFEDPRAPLPRSASAPSRRFRLRLFERVRQSTDSTPTAPPPCSINIDIIIRCFPRSLALFRCSVRRNLNTAPFVAATTNTRSFFARSFSRSFVLFASGRFSHTARNVLSCSNRSISSSCSNLVRFISPDPHHFARSFQIDSDRLPSSFHFQLISSRHRGLYLHINRIELNSQFILSQIKLFARFSSISLFFSCLSVLFHCFVIFPSKPNKRTKYHLICFFFFFFYFFCFRLVAPFGAAEAPYFQIVWNDPASWDWWWFSTAICLQSSLCSLILWIGALCNQTRHHSPVSTIFVLWFSVWLVASLCFCLHFYFGPSLSGFLPVALLRPPRSARFDWPVRF